MTPAMDVIIVSYNTKSDLLRCLTSVFAHPPRSLGAVVVVDNASDDGSVDAVRSQWPQVRVIALERNVGFAAANNRAIKETASPLILLLNSDTIVAAGALDRLTDRLLETKAVAAGPRLVDTQGRPEVSYGSHLSPLNELVQRYRVRQSVSSTPSARRYVSSLVAHERNVDWITAACLLVKRDAAIAAGLFDERYFMYEEDVDFCAALRHNGGRILFTPSAQITHLRGRSAQGTPGQVSAHYDRSHLAFYEKHHPGWLPWLRGWLRLRGRLPKS